MKTTTTDDSCNSYKCGEFNPLRCVQTKGHDGPHNYVVAGQYPKPPLAPSTHTKLLATLYLAGLFTLAGSCATTQTAACVQPWQRAAEHGIVLECTPHGYFTQCNISGPKGDQDLTFRSCP